ncbi:MAG TPA: hypothetical protein PLF92_00475 [Arenimonas sp.]|nr:hypothetical protein [Arenimonas sp.]HPW31357.1 hypothetical protein [Arenimonas sp.]
MRYAKAIFVTAISIVLSACNENGKINAEVNLPATSTAVPTVKPAIGAASATAENPEPSFDCAKADSSAQKLVCTDPNLAALDREVDRLFLLAKNGKSLSDERRKELLALQRGWIKGRDDCWKSDDLRYCIVDSYVSRIHELRQGYAEARSEDAKGISEGPTALKCEGLHALVSVTRVKSSPLSVFLGWTNRWVVLEAGKDGSGYAGKAFDGTFRLSVKDADLLFEQPDKSVFKCVDEPTG